MNIYIIILYHNHFRIQVINVTRKLKLKLNYSSTLKVYRYCHVSLQTVNHPKKIKFEEEPTTWYHHRGGWANSISALRELYAHDGVLCISAIEESVIFDGKTIDEPWVGFVHHVPRNNFPHYPDLERLVTNKHFIESLKQCYGLFVLCNVVKSFLLEELRSSYPNISIVRILYPITPFPEEKHFNWRKFDETECKRLIFIGMCLRNFQPFFDLKVPSGFQKCLIKAPMIDFDDLYDCNKRQVSLRMNDSVVIKERVNDSEYDDLLSSSVVFLNMYDAPAVTTVIECLGRSTPILINRLPGVEEYLGKEYPLLYNTLDEAEKMLRDRHQLEEATAYMQSHPLLPQLTNQAFLNAFAGSPIYRSLPLPASQQ